MNYTDDKKRIDTVIWYALVILAIVWTTCMMRDALHGTM